MAKKKWEVKAYGREEESSEKEGAPGEVVEQVKDYCEEGGQAGSQEGESQTARWEKGGEEESRQAQDRCTGRCSAGTGTGADDRTDADVRAKHAVQRGNGVVI